MAFRLKETSAGLAVSTGMDRGLAIMFVKSMITLEYSAASTTIIMTGLIMFLEVIFVCEVFITILAIVMARALNTMLFSNQSRCQSRCRIHRRYYVLARLSYADQEHESLRNGGDSGRSKPFRNVKLVRKEHATDTQSSW